MGRKMIQYILLTLFIFLGYIFIGIIEQNEFIVKKSATKIKKQCLKDD
jgi:hypothetical protein